MGPNADTATIGSNTSPEDYRGASTDDPDELREISSLVRSDLWWAEDECKGLEKATVRSPLWRLIPILILLLCLTFVYYAFRVGPEIFWIFPDLLILPLVIVIVLIFVIVGAGYPYQDPYEEKHARIRELKAELEFVQDKIKRIEDAQR